MTCIVGYKEDGKVYIGGDSAGVCGWNISIRNDPKVFKNGDMIFGCTSSFRMINLLRYKLVIPYHKSEVDTYQYLCTDFIDAVINCFKDNGYANISSNKVSGGIFLLGYKKGLYYIDNDFQIAENDENFASCGCGESYALGVMKSLEEEKSSMLPEIRINKALSIASHFSAGVSHPFNIVII